MASLDEALERYSGPLETRARDLHRHLVSGELPSAARHVSTNGETETFFKLMPAFWPDLAIVPGSEELVVTMRNRRPGVPINAPGIRPVDPRHPLNPSGGAAARGGTYLGGTWHFFVRRVALDKPYPPSPPMGAEAPAPPATSLLPASPPKKVSEADLRDCLLAIVNEHPKDTPPPDEETLHAAMELRLGTPLGRNRVREIRDDVAPDFKLPRGRPPTGAQ
jgi:hypothetical protein